MKKILSVMLSMALILTYIPGISFAEESQPDAPQTPAEEETATPTHLNGVTEKEDGVVYGTSIEYNEVTYYYADLQAAIADAEPEDTIKLEKSFAISSGLYISAEKPLTIDLAGNSITSGGSRIYIGYDGTNYYASDITVTDSVGGGKITASSSQAVIYVSSGSFTLAGGSISNSYNPSGEYAYGIYAKRSSKVNITGGSITSKVGVRGLPAAVSMTGGEINSTAVGVFLNGTETEKASFSMTGGKIECGQNVGIYTYSYANVNISGGEIDGEYGIQTKDTTDISINDGTISGSFASVAVSGNSKATLNEGRLLNSVIIEGDGAKFVMNGGKVSGSGSDAAIVTNDNEDGGKCNVIINGGEITADTTAMYLAQPGTVTIKGGKITGSNGITVMSGKLDISPVSSEDLTIEAKGTPYAEGTPIDNKSSDSGVAVAVIGSEKNTGNIELNISGGNIRSDYGMALWVYNQEGSGKIRHISVNGGSFTGGSYNQNRYSAAAASGAAGFATGGSFSGNVTELLALGYALTEAEGRWVVSDGVKYQKETNDVKEDANGNEVTTVTSEGKDALGNKVTKTVTSTKGADGAVTKTTETVYEYEQYVLSYKEGETGKVSVHVTAKAETDAAVLSKALVHAALCAETNGASAVTRSLTVITEEEAYTASTELLNSADIINLECKSGKYTFTKATIEHILSNMTEETFSLSAESYASLKETRIASAKAAKAGLTSISKSSSKVTAKWDKVEGVDGYVLKLITGGKTYTVTIDNPETVANTFTQTVSKSYRVKIATYTMVDGEKIVSSYTYKTSVSAPSISSVKKNSSTNKVTVKWGKVSSVDGYRVQLITGGKTTTKYVTGTSYTFSNKVTKSYRVKVSAYSVIEGKKAYSAVKTKTSIAKPKVTALSKNSSGKVTVKWSKLSTVDGYRIKLNANDTSYTKTITKNSTTSYTFSNKVKGEYTVSIAAYSVIEGEKVFTDYKTYTLK